MNKRISDSNKTTLTEDEKYKEKILSFANYTIHNPEFFALSPEEQKKEALAYIKKHREGKE